MRRGNVLRLLAATGVAVLLAGCSGQGEHTTAADGVQHGAQSSGRAEPVKTTEADWKGVAEALGRPGKLAAGDTVYRFGFPRRDLKVVSRGVQIKPGLALGSWMSFARYGDGKTMVMGDLTLTDDELPKVADALQSNGLGQIAQHKHLLTHEPSVWWTHFHGEADDAAKLARGARAALDVTATPPPAEAAPAGQLDLDTAAIDTALGTKGTNDGGVYKFNFARTETVTIHGRVVPPAMGGITTVINFQPTGGGKAAINGDFAMTAAEVQNVIKALRAGGIEIVELHQHALDDDPRLFYMHFWANEDAAKLAVSLRKAIDVHSAKPAG